MSAWSVRPLRHLMVATALGLTAGVFLAVWLVGLGLGRRAEEQQGALTSSLQLNADLESQRLQAALQEQQRGLDRMLSALLDATARAAPADAPLAAPKKVCDTIELAAGVVRAGVVDLAEATVVALVEPGEKGCVDRWWALQVQALSGPPYPAPVDIARQAQAAMYGMGHVVDGQTVVTGVHRSGIGVHVRLARASAGRAAFVDVKLADLPPPPAVSGVRLDSYLTVGGVAVGYIHGGPGVGMVPAAVKRIKKREELVNQLPVVVEAAASRAVLAWEFPEHFDDGDLALAAREVPLESQLPHPLGLSVVSSAPWPSATADLRWRLLVLVLAAAGMQLILVVLLTRRLSRALSNTANQVRVAWMPALEGEPEPTDDERAARLLAAMSEGTRDTLGAAYGKDARHWSGGPLQRLLDLLHSRLGPRG